MPSSTSSSDTSASDRVPRGPWVRAWLLAFVVVVLTLSSLELHWRSMGHRPSVVDDKDLWSYYRHRVYEGGHQSVVLLGSSRMQLGFSTPVFHRRFPHHSLSQLAINGRAPMAVLRDLANDEDFRGIVICEIWPGALERQHREEQEEYVRHHHREAGWNSMWNRRLASCVQAGFVVVNRQVNLLRLMQDDLPLRPLYLVTHGDRSRAADYRLADIEAQRRLRIRRLRDVYSKARAPAPEAWLAEALEVEPWVKRIQERGGQVVFVRFPTSGPLHRMEQARYPKARYWDRFAARTGAIVTHFADEPTLSGFDCPDHSHLDQRDAPAFTKALLDLLVVRGTML